MGTIRLLDFNGQVVTQSFFKCESEKIKFIKRCERFYPAAVLKKCSYDIDETASTKPVPGSIFPVVIVPNEPHKPIVKQKSPWKKNKYGVRGGSNGKKITQVRASRYY